MLSTGCDQLGPPVGSQGSETPMSITDDTSVADILDDLMDDRVDDGAQKDRRRRLVAFIGGGLTFLCLLTGASVWAVPNIEDDLERAARQLLREADIDVDGADGAGLTFDMDGRSIEVSGDVATAGEALRIDELLTQQRGLRDADVTSLNVRAAPTATAQVQVLVTDTNPRTITLAGIVPTDAARLQLIRAASAAFGAANVVDELEVSGLAAAAGTGEGINALAAAITGLGADGVTRASASLNGRDVSVQALVADAAAEVALAAVIDGANADITVLEVEAGLVRMDFEVDDGLIRLNDTVLTEAQRDVLITAAADASGITYDDVAADLVVSGLAEAIPGSDERVANVAALFPALSDTASVLRARGSLDGEDLTVDAVVTSDEAGADIAALVAGAGGTASVTVEERQSQDETSALNAAFVDLNLRLQEVVAFRTASSDLTAEAAEIIDEAIVALSEYPDPVVTVSGHSSDSGAANFNLTLSQSRAEAVVAYLAFGGVDPDRLTAEGRGITDMLPDVDVTDSRQQRVQFEAFPA